MSTPGGKRVAFVPIGRNRSAKEYNRGDVRERVLGKGEEKKLKRKREKAGGWIEERLESENVRTGGRHIGGVMEAMGYFRKRGQQLGR